MTNPYLRAFVIGSSFFVFAPFFWAVSRFKPEQFHFSYIPYTFLAPFALGMMNVVSLVIAEQYHLSMRYRHLVMSLIAPTIVLATIIVFKIYNYTMKEWIRHIVLLYLFYFVIFNVIVFNLDKYV